MKNVGILSMQRIKNYGSFMQAYALKKTIESLGNNVEFVDYHVESPIIDNKTTKIKKIRELFLGKAPFIQKMQYIKHKKNFGNKYLNFLGLKDEYNYLPKLDTLVIGSDEVFNCIQANNNVGYSMELFGKNNNSSRVITYAASFGNTTIEKLKKYNVEDEIGNLLNNIDNISVRDENSASIVKKLTNKQVEKNLDPVLIYNFKEDPLFNADISLSNEKYIILYAYANRISEEESNYIKKFAKDKGFKIYAIGGPQKCADKFIDCSPYEILSYFKNAELIITDTFHGSIFSIINEKKFVTLVRKSIGNNYGNEEKLRDLLDGLGLKSQIIYSANDIDKVNKEIDYKKVNEIIKEQQKKTLKYLEMNV